DAFHEEQFPIFAHLSADVFQNPGAALVVPIMDDMAHEVNIGARWDRLEEVAADDLAPICQTSRLDVGLGPFHNALQIEQDAMHAGIFLQHGGKHAAVASTNVG